MADSTRRLTTQEVVDRIEARSIPEPNSGCTLWEGMTGALAGGRTVPYGVIRHKGKMTGVHRVIYEHAYGSIPAGACVCHRCDVSLCCNPEHLFLGTNDDNHADKARKDRGKKKLTHAKAVEMHKLRASGMIHADLAKMFNVTRPTVSRILSGARRSNAAASAE